MSKIALVHVALIVDGERKLFQPGEELPALSKHDEQALLTSQSIQDPKDVASAEKNAAAEQRAGDRAFEEARKQVKAADASIQAAPAKTAAKK